MQKLGLSEDIETLKSNEEIETEAAKGFWRRQFGRKTTSAQRTFDWLFGVILPVVCFTFDPVVFSASPLSDYKVFAYILSFTSVMAMAAWLIWGARLKWLNAFIAGLFAVVGAVALGIGILIFPISLLGLIVLIGALGLTPLFTAVVFLRNSARAFDAAQPFLEKKILVYSFLLAALFSAVVPSIANVEVNKFKRETRRERNFEGDFID